MPQEVQGLFICTLHAWLSWRFCAPAALGELLEMNHLERKSDHFQDKLWIHGIIIIDDVLIMHLHRTSMLSELTLSHRGVKCRACKEAIVAVAGQALDTSQNYSTNQYAATMCCVFEGFAAAVCEIQPPSIQAVWLFGHRILGSQPSLTNREQVILPGPVHEVNSVGRFG